MAGAATFKPLLHTLCSSAPPNFSARRLTDTTPLHLPKYIPQSTVAHLDFPSNHRLPTTLSNCVVQILQSWVCASGKAPAQCGWCSHVARLFTDHEQVPKRIRKCPWGLFSKMKVCDDGLHMRITTSLTTSQTTAPGLTKWKICLYLVRPLTKSGLGDALIDISGEPTASDSRPSYGSDRRGFSSMAPSGGDRFAGECAPSGPLGLFWLTLSEDRRDGYPPREQLPLPTQPPYTAHLANLSFDATQGDVNDFFNECQVTNVRIVEDKLDRKPKGFGYVEFATLDGLKAALNLSGNNLAGRQVRVSVAEPRKYSHWCIQFAVDLIQYSQRTTGRPRFQ